MAEGTVTATAVPPAPPQAAQPSTVDLRPLSTSELIDRGFSLYRAHFAGFLLLALLCQSAPLLSQILVTLLKLNPSQEQALNDPAGFFERLGELGGISLIAQLIAFGFEVVITYYIADAYLGKDPSVKASLRRFSSCFLQSTWTCILNRVLIGLTLLFPFGVMGVACFYVKYYTPTTFGPLIALGVITAICLIVSFAPVLIVFMRLMVTIPALALEGLSGWKSVKRSASLVRYDPGLGFLYWGEMRLSFLLLPLFIIELMILSLTSLPLTIHQIGEVIRNGSTGQIAPPPDFIMVLSQILTFLAGSLILPLYAIATTLFYYDIRIRREGFDLEFMANRLRSRK